MLSRCHRREREIALDVTEKRHVPAGGGARPRVAHDVAGVLDGLGGSHAHAPLPARRGGRSAGAGPHPDRHRDKSLLGHDLG